MFLKNQWYIAAWSHEIGRSLLARRIAGEPVVFYRTAAGQAVAFEDRCPHRLAPLSRGRLKGDTLECGYHGVTFAADGACVHMPGQETIPNGAHVRAYRLEERWGWVWIWLGDTARADTALLPEFHWMAEPGWTPLGGTLHFKAHYQLLLDNLLDLSHEAFLHAGTIGNAAVADVPATMRAEGDKVHVTRFMPGCPPPPLFVRARGFTGKIDRLQDITFSPPCYVAIDVCATPAGANDRRDALEWRVLNALTPETESTTHYFWGMPRHFALEDRELDTMLERAIVKTFNEDREMLEAQQVTLEEASLDQRSLMTDADAGPSRARSVIARLLREEQPRPPGAHQVTPVRESVSPAR